MLAVFVEHTERWDHPVYALALFGLIAFLALSGVTRIGFLLFLVVATTQLLMMQFPDVANHVNLILYVNLLLMCSIGYSLLAKATQSDDGWFETVRPLLQLTMVLVYVLAGFHKLNSDFINTDVSCVQRTISLLRHMLRSSVLGIPTILIVAFGGAGLSAWLLAASPLRRHLTRALLVAALGIVTFALLPENMDASLKAWPVAGMIVVVLLWEVVGGLLLLVPRAQLPVVALSWSMHAVLAMIAFVDFGALAFALLFAFVPAHYQQLMGASVILPWLRWRVPRPLCYLVLILMVGLCQLWSTVAAGIVFNAATMVLLWPLLSALVGRTERLPWPGIPIRFGGTPRGLLVFPVLLGLFAFTGYLGLRTAGNFSMFSNLRTEGERSNHFLLGSNPLKIWGYQEDVVHFVAVDHETARIGYNYQALEGNSLPVVEFRKLIAWWTEAGVTVPLTFEYQGTRTTTSDIVNDPTWRTAGWDWEMRLMDFRVIQPEGPNRCRW